MATVYCLVEFPKLEGSYPYVQPFEPYDEEAKYEYDLVNTNVRSDMFYKPKKVNDWERQNEKWWDTWLI